MQRLHEAVEEVLHPLDVYLSEVVLNRWIDLQSDHPAKALAKILQLALGQLADVAVEQAVVMVTVDPEQVEPCRAMLELRILTVQGSHKARREGGNLGHVMAQRIPVLKLGQSLLGRIERDHSGDRHAVGAIRQDSVFKECGAEVFNVLLNDKRVGRGSGSSAWLTG